MLGKLALQRLTPLIDVGKNPIANAKESGAQKQISSQRDINQPFEKTTESVLHGGLRSVSLPGRDLRSRCQKAARSVRLEPD